MALGEGSFPFFFEQVIVEVAHGSQLVGLEEVFLDFRSFFVGRSTCGTHGIPCHTLLIGAHHLCAIEFVGDTELAAVRNFRRAYLATLCFYQNDTLCGTCTVDGGRCVFQDGDAFHLAGIQVIECFFVGHEVVDYIKRAGTGLTAGSGIARSYVGLTDLQGGCFARATETAAGAQTVDQSAEGCTEATYGEVLYLVGTDDFDGAGYVFHLLRAVTHYDHFVELHHVFAHHDVHAVFCRHYLRRVADVGDAEFGICGHLQGKVSVEVCDCACGRSVDFNRGADDGHAYFVDHRTFDGFRVLLLGGLLACLLCMHRFGHCEHRGQAQAIKDISCLHKVQFLKYEYTVYAYSAVSPSGTSGSQRGSPVRLASCSEPAGVKSFNISLLLFGSASMGSV